MLITYVLLVLLFIVGLIGTGIFLKFPTNNKFTPLVQSLQNTTTTSNKLVQRSTPNSNIVITKAEKTAMKSNTSSSQFNGELKSVFDTFDKNNDGHITQQELKESLTNIGITMSDRDVKEMVERVDSNGDGLIDLDEFCELSESMMMTRTREEAMINADEKGKEKEEVEGGGGGGGYLKEAFDVFDGDGDGEITVEELGLILSSLGFKEGKKLENCREMIRKVDMDGDGKINFDEFKKMMKAGTRFLPVS